MPNLKLGILLWTQAAAWPEMVGAVRRVDRLGYDSVWAWDHLYAIFGDPYQPVFEGWGVLHAWAMATERARLGLMVGANTFRNPGLVAKQAVTLDHVSGGRAVLGIGGAWMEAEHVAHGIDFGTGFGQRLDWLDESVAAMRGLLDGRTITSPEGGHYRFRELRHSPLPVQPRLPILVGGTGRKKTLRTVARHADIWNCFGTVAQAAELDGVLRAHCAAVGRDEREIERQINLWVLIRDSAQAARQAWEQTAIHNRCPLEGMTSESRPVLGPVELVADRLRAYREAGFGSVLIEVPAPYDIETLERLVGEVKPLVDAS